MQCVLNKKIYGVRRVDIRNICILLLSVSHASITMNCGH